MRINIIKSLNSDPYDKSNITKSAYEANQFVERHLPFYNNIRQLNIYVASSWLVAHFRCTNLLIFAARILLFPILAPLMAWQWRNATALGSRSGNDGFIIINARYLERTDMFPLFAQQITLIILGSYRAPAWFSCGTALWIQWNAADRNLLIDPLKPELLQLVSTREPITKNQLYFDSSKMRRRAYHIFSFWAIVYLMEMGQYAGAAERIMRGGSRLSCHELIDFEWKQFVQDVFDWTTASPNHP